MTVPIASRTDAARGWTRIPDPRTTPRPRRRCGPHRDGDGTPLHGGYERLLDGQVDGIAYWHGHVLHRWRGPAMPRFSSSLVSVWNLIRGIGLVWAVAAAMPWSLQDPDRWVPGALLEGLKPYGYFGMPSGRARAWACRAAAAGVAAHLATTDHPGVVSLSAGSREPYQTLFDLDALVADYQAVLSPETLATEVLTPLEAYADRSPADFAGDFAALEAQPLPLLGLTLGYPPSVTASRSGAAGAACTRPRCGASPGPARMSTAAGIRPSWPRPHGTFWPRHHITPRGVEDPSYIYNQGLRWATDLDHPDPGL